MVFTWMIRLTVEGSVYIYVFNFTFLFSCCTFSSLLFHTLVFLPSILLPIQCYDFQFGWTITQDSESDHIYHSELFTLTKRMARGESQKLSFTVPIFEPHPPQYYIRAVSDSWLQAEAFYCISFQKLALPQVTVFCNIFYESFCCGIFASYMSHFSIRLEPHIQSS